MGRHSLEGRSIALATSLAAPMAGKILKIEKNVGETVDEDEVVVIMEALKMEIPVVAPVSGVVQKVTVSPGQPVEAGELIAEIG
jgi:biotin carboxyl carrier protein